MLEESIGPCSGLIPIVGGLLIMMGATVTDVHFSDAPLHRMQNFH
jgi:hypothetical protein